MMKPMTTQLSRKWWYVAVVALLSSLLTNLLLDAAGMPARESPAQWLVYFLCLVSFWRSIDFILWLAVLLVAPASKLLDPAK